MFGNERKAGVGRPAPSAWHAGRNEPAGRRGLVKRGFVRMSVMVRRLQMMLMGMMGMVVRELWNHGRSFRRAVFDLRHGKAYRDWTVTLNTREGHRIGGGVNGQVVASAVRSEGRGDEVWGVIIEKAS